MPASASIEGRFFALTRHGRPHSFACRRRGRVWRRCPVLLRPWAPRASRSRLHGNHIGNWDIAFQACEVVSRVAQSRDCGRLRRLARRRLARRPLGMVARQYQMARPEYRTHMGQISSDPRLCVTPIRQTQIQSVRTCMTPIRGAGISALAACRHLRPPYDPALVERRTASTPCRMASRLTAGSRGDWSRIGAVF